MSCALTQGYSVADCKGGGLGGAKEVYIIELANIASMTATAGVITALSKATGKRFWKYQQIKETSYGKETLQANEANGSNYWQHEVGIVLNRMKSSTRAEIVLLAQNIVAIVVKDNNGSFWLYGKENGLQLSANEGGTGTAMPDRNGYTLTFTGAEAEPAIEIAAAVAADLETAGS